MAGYAGLQGFGTDLNPNNYLLNVVPVFNTIGGSGGEDATATNTASITAINGLVNTTTFTGAFNTLRSYNSGAVIVSDPLYVTSGALAVGQEGVGAGFACDINGNLNVNGSIQYNGSLTNLSDERFKADIRSLDSKDSLEKVCSLQGRRFAWKATGESDLGFIAQELQEVLPEVVAKDSEGNLRVAPLKLLPYLVEAIKALQERVVELERRA